MANRILTDTPDRLFMEIKDLFSSHFDQPWLINAIEESCSHSPGIDSIRRLLEITSGKGTVETQLILGGIRALREFTRALESSILPSVHILFRINRRIPGQSKETVLLKKCLIYTLPENTRRLAFLTMELETALMRRSLGEEY